MAQTKTSFQGKIRSYGGTNKGDASPGVAVLSVMFSFNPVTAANTDGTTNVKIGTSATTGEEVPMRMPTQKHMHAVRLDQVC